MNLLQMHVKRISRETLCSSSLRYKQNVWKFAHKLYERIALMLTKIDNCFISAFLSHYIVLLL